MAWTRLVAVSRINEIQSLYFKNSQSSGKQMDNYSTL